MHDLQHSDDEIQKTKKFRSDDYGKNVPGVPWALLTEDCPALWQQGSGHEWTHPVS